jgi:hypothetical protein
VLRNALGPERGDVVENGGKCIIRKFLSLPDNYDSGDRIEQKHVARMG